MHDVFLYGMISASTVYVLDDNFEYPRPNEYAEIKQAYNSVGGEAVNSAIVLSKFGKTTKLDGNWLNQKNAGKILNLLKPFDIDTTRLTISQDHGTEELVITDKNTRTPFGNYVSFHKGERQWNIPQESDIQNASFVSLDPYFREESTIVADLCVKNRKPYVTLDCKYDDFISVNAEAVIISHELRDRAYAGHDLKSVFESYQRCCQGLVIFTFGSDELWYGRRDQQIKKFSPYKITPVDTTGAGDSFRAGIVYGLMNSWADESTVEFASAVAACVCLTIPHTLNAPRLDGVLSFMKEKKEIL